MAVRVQAAVGKEKGCVAGGSVDDYKKSQPLRLAFHAGAISAHYGDAFPSAVFTLQQTTRTAY
jgi:hypothetical protein